MALILTVAAVALTTGFTVRPSWTQRSADTVAIVARAWVWATIAERDLVPEGTAWDPATRSVLVGSLHKNKVVAISRDGRVTDRVRARSGGLGSVVGIHVDPVRRVLWVASNRRFDRSSDTARSALFAFDAATGAFRSRFVAPGEGPNFLNDLATGRDGTVYLTDTQAGGVWVLRPGAKRLERFGPAEGLRQPNGITISTDARHLFIAARDGIRVVSLADGRSWPLAVPDSIDVTHIDGLAFAGDALIGHHPLEAWRIARYQLDPGHRAIVGRYLFEAGTADSRTSTTGEVVGHEYVFIGNGQIDRMNLGTIDSAAMDPVRMYRVPLRPQPDGLVAVALSARDSVALYDAQTLDRIATLPVGRNPHEIAASADGRRAFVADARDTSITVLEVAPIPRVAATWYLPDSIGVHDLAATADGRTLWAISGERQLVFEIDPASGAVRRRLPISKPGGWMIETGGPSQSLVIANLEGGGVTLLSAATGRETFLSGKEGVIDAASSRGGEVWSVNLRDGMVTVFGSAGRIVDRQPSGKGTVRVVLAGMGRTALTVNGRDSTVVAFDVRTKRRTGSLAVPSGPKVMAVSRDGRRAYLTHPERGLLTMVDLTSMTVLRSISVPGTPDGVAVVGDREMIKRE